MTIKERILNPKNLWHVGAVVLFLAVSCIYFYPALKGYTVEAHDVKTFKGMSQEIQDYRENGDQQILWTNSMFGGMPSDQISMIHEGTGFIRFMNRAFSLWLPRPISFLFALFLSFYIMACTLRIKPLFSAFGALAYGFSTYFIVIIQAGHNSKVIALGLAPLVIAGFILAYRRKQWILGVALSALFMGMQIGANHLQITYYFAFILIVMGIVEFVRYLQKQQLVKFAKITGGMILAYALAVFMNIGNITGTSEYAKHTIRGGSDLAEFQEDTLKTAQDAVGKDGKLPVEYITHWSYGKSETWTLLVPNYKGGKSIPIGANPDNKDHVQEATAQWRPFVSGAYQYWGNQPGTSGPVYVGAFLFLLAVISLFYVKEKYIWALFGISLLAILLSWGKNFLGFTEFFVDVVPLYGSFRTVTMILVIVEFAMPLMALFFLHRLYKKREEIAENLTPFFIGSGVVLLLLLLMALVPTTFNEFLTTMESDQLAEITDPNLVSQYDDAFGQLETVRMSIFTADVWRSILFVLLGAGAIFAFVKKVYNAEVLGGILIVLVLLDLVPVNKRYLGTEEQGKGYKQWQETFKQQYPYTAGDAEKQIYEMEVSKDPELAVKVEQELATLRKSFDKDVSGSEKQRKLDWLKFRVLNRHTNYRVYEQGNLTSSSYAPYFHKTIGGYHGAKLSRYQDLIANQLMNDNRAVQSMLNMRYVITPRADQRGNINNSQLLRINENAMGNAWFVKEVKFVDNAMEEMNALNSNQTFNMEVKSVTPVFVNGQQAQGTVTLNGTEGIEFLNFQVGPDLQPMIDTVAIGMPFTVLKPGEKIAYVRDSLGLNWVYAQGLDSTFDQIITLETSGVVGFDPSKEAVVDRQWENLISKTSYSGEGTIEMTSYHPMEMVYSYNSPEDQLAVFSEIHYPVGWTAYIDDQPQKDIARVNYVLRALEVPAGEHTIKFVYESESYSTSGTITWSANIATILLLAFGIYTESKRKDEEEDDEDEDSDKTNNSTDSAKEDVAEDKDEQA